MLLHKITNESLQKHLEKKSDQKKLFVFFGFSPSDLSELSEYKLYEDKYPQKLEDFKHSPASLMGALMKIQTETPYFWCTAVFCNRKVQRIATKNTECCHPIFTYFLDNALVKRKLWPVYEIIWAW